MELSPAKEINVLTWTGTTDRVVGPFDAVIARYYRACMKQYARDRRFRRDFQTKNEQAALSFYQGAMSKLAALNG